MAELGPFQPVTLFNEVSSVSELYFVLSPGGEACSVAGE